MQQPRHVRPVVGTRSEAHLDEALAASAIRLDAAELAWLETGREQ
jgi:aryl-alcohol dehydrogenase-like predicted oxidoreductase